MSEKEKNPFFWNHSRRSLKGKVCIEYLKKYPLLPCLTLAKIMMKENPTMFTKQQDTRQMVQYYKGRKGMRGKKIDSPFYQSTYNLPEPVQSELIPWGPFTFPESCQTGLVMADLHIPFHHNTPIRVAFKEGQKSKVDFILLNGDIWDCYSNSKFETDPRIRDKSVELEKVNQFLDSLQKAFPKAKIYWKEGNHERRYQRDIRSGVPDLLKYLRDSGREQDDTGILNVSGLLLLHNRNITWIAEQRPLVFGSYLNILHGDEYARGTAITVNPARTAFLKLMECALVAHSHTSSQHTGKTVGEKEITTWSQGCMCDLHPEYARINQWNWGFAIIERIGKDGFRVYNRRVSLKGEVW